MSKEEIKEDKPKIDLFLDLDDTLVRNDLVVYDGAPIFNGAENPGELGSFVAIKEWPEEYADFVDLRTKVLSSRPFIQPNSFETAKRLGLLPRLKSTDETFESETGEIYFAIHYPNFGKIYLLLDNQELNIEMPCYVWQKQQGGGGFLTYYYSNYHNERLLLKSSETAQIDSLIDKSSKNGLLDAKQHDKLIQTIFKLAPVNRLITYSAEGKQVSNTNLDESDIDPAYHFTHVPKAWIMAKLREQSSSQVLVSILLDDLEDHKKFFKEKDIWVDCSTLSSLDFGSSELFEEVNQIIIDAQDKINMTILAYKFYKENLTAFAPLLTKDFSIEAKLTHFNPVTRWNSFERYQEEINGYEYEDADYDYLNSKFLKLMVLCDDFVILSKEKNFKSFDEEKSSVNPLDLLLEFAYLSNCWSAETMGGQIFSKLYPQGILEIRKLLKNGERTIEDYADLLMSLEYHFQNRSDAYSPKLLIFFSFISKFHSIQSLRLPGFNQAAKVIITEFSKELELPLPPKNLVCQINITAKTELSSGITAGVSVSR